MTVHAETPAGRRTPRLASERRWLESMHRRYHRRELVDPDPLMLVFPYATPIDREVAALVAAALAYGNVKAMLPAIREVLDPLGPAPARRLARTTPATITRTLRGFRYRFTPGRQVAGLLVAIRSVQRRWGGLEACFVEGLDAADETVLPALARFVDVLAAASPAALDHLIPHPDGGSACKRLHLFLRWMARSDAVDPGGWPRVAPRRLVMPLDTHVHRTALARGWTTRRSADGRTAQEVTALLRAIRPDDPLRYDFAITRPGIRDEPQGAPRRRPQGAPTRSPRRDA
jgi:uncharacterized protein (TIGR02757 family)